MNKYYLYVGVPLDATPVGETLSNIHVIYAVVESSAVNKKLKEKYMECHSHKPQPIPDIKRKRKRTEINACKINKQTHEKHIDQLSLPQAR